MNMYFGLIAALLIALILTGVSVVILRRRGPWSSAWTFFLILFLTLWTVSIYVGKRAVYWDIAWMPIVITGILLAALLAGISPAANHLGDKNISQDMANAGRSIDAPQTPSTPVGLFFWVLIVLLVIAIFIGMLHPQRAL